MNGLHPAGSAGCFLSLHNGKKCAKLEKNKNSLHKEITNITHDLRTPLTSALGYIDLILNSDMSDIEKENSLKIVQTRLARLEELVNSFFEFNDKNKTKRNNKDKKF